MKYHSEFNTQFHKDLNAAAGVGGDMCIKLEIQTSYRSFAAGTNTYTILFAKRCGTHNKLTQEPSKVVHNSPI